MTSINFTCAVPENGGLRVPVQAIDARQAACAFVHARWEHLNRPEQIVVRVDSDKCWYEIRVDAEPPIDPGEPESGIMFSGLLLRGGVFA